MSRSSRALVVTGVVVLVVCASSLAVAAVPFGLDSPSEVDVSDQVIQIGYEHYSFDGIARVERGEDLAIQGTAPASASYWVDLYDSDRRPVAFSDRSLQGNDSTSFDTDYLTPGSYIAVLVHEDEIRAVLPVVVEGYAVSVEDVPDTAEAGAELTVTATLSKDPKSPEKTAVELAVLDSESDRIVTRRAMTGDGDTYSGTVRLDRPGEYEVYVNVRGEKDVRGHAVLLGFSDPRSLSVTGTPPSTETAGDDGTAEPTATDTAPPATAEPTPTGAPDGVITRNATLGTSSPSDRRPVGPLSLVFALFLIVGLVYWFRR